MQSEIAGMGRRLLATALDFVILMVALPVMTRNVPLSHPALWWALVFAVAVVYSALFGVLMGRTPGKMVLGLRVIDAQGRGLNYVQMFLRAVLKWSLFFALFFAMSLLTPAELYQHPADGEEVATVETGPALALSAVMVIGTLGWLILIHLARRHPDGQGLHDRAAETYVIKTG